MKGGKQGRKRRGSGGSNRQKPGRGAAKKKESAARRWKDAPGKAGRGKPEYGAFRTSEGDE